MERAQERDLQVRGGIHDGVRQDVSNAIGNVNYAVGDYSRIKESVGKADRFNAITCLSRSFIYLGERANYVKALKDFFDLLEPGGKIVLQSRKHISKGDLPWSKEMSTSLSQTPEGHYSMTDEKIGTKFVWRTNEKVTVMSDGVKQTTGSRYLEYSDGTRKELGIVIADDHLDFDNLTGMGDMLREVGFTNIQLKAENLASDGTEIMFAIAAEKPRSSVHR